MNRQQNRSRNRDDYDKFNRNRPRNNDDRRRNDGNRGWRRNDQDSRMGQHRGGIGGGGGGGGGGGYGAVNMGGYNQNMPAYGQQNQMANYGGFGNAPAAPFQQNRFGMNQQQRINPWANNVMPGMAASGEEAKLAMNILNAVLSSSGPSGSGRGMSPPPNKMRRMDHREGGYDDRRRRPRSPPGRSSHQNRQQSSQRFGMDRRGREGYSSNQRNDDHRFRNSVNKNPGVTRSSRQSSVRSSEVVQRKRQSFEERERETKEYSDLPAKALKCRMCDKSEFHNVAAYLAHVHSKGHAKVAKAYHEKIAALTTLLKQNAKLALHKEILKAKASGIKVSEKECRVCEAPMVFGSMKHKNILACKILHKFTNQTLCCGKDHKYRNMVEEHCLTLAHLKAKYESEHQSEEKEKEGKQEEIVEDEHEKISRQKRDEARRKRKFGDDETDEEEEEDEDEENEDTKGKDSELNNGNEKQEEDNITEEKQQTNSDDGEKMEINDESTEGIDDEKDKGDTSSANDDIDATSQEEKREKEGKEEGSCDNQAENMDEKQQEIDEESDSRKEEDRKGKKFRSRSNRKDIDQAKIVQQMTMQELLEYYKKFLVDDPEKLSPYDPANPTGINYIETHVAFHCMACIEYYPASLEELMSHCCSKDHYKMFRSKYMKLQGVRDSPTSLSRLKAAREREIRKEKETSQETDTKDSKDKQEDNKEDGDHKDKDPDSGTGDDALYDPYEGESGDLTTLLQDKKSDVDPESQVPEGYEVQDEVHGSEPENYEDNILDYDEDVAEDPKDDDDHENQQEDAEYNEGDENVEDEEEDDFQGDENVEDEEEDDYQGDENEYQDNENADYQGDENFENEEDGNYEDQEEADDEEDAPASVKPARRGRSKRAF